MAVKEAALVTSDALNSVCRRFESDTLGTMIIFNTSYFNFGSFRDLLHEDWLRFERYHPNWASVASYKVIVTSTRQSSGLSGPLLTG